MSRAVRLSPVADLLPFVQGLTLVAFNVGPDGTVYLVIALRPTQYRDTLPSGVSFARIVPDEPQSYRVLGLADGQTVLDVTIEDEPFNIHDIQPVGSRLLLVCCRSRHRGPKDFDKNGRVYTRGGKFVREILLGDGIQTVQATADGTVWTSYFDEGVFGNFGWDRPVGAAGLVAWDATGRKRYEFIPSDGLDTICDCYALNAATDDDVWLCYYTEFPLVRLHRRAVAGVWRVPVKGSHAFAVADGYALFQGGYNDRDHFRLLDLGDGKGKQVGTFHVGNEKGRRLQPVQRVGRGDAIHLIDGHDLKLYRFDVGQAVAAARPGRAVTTPKRRPRKGR